MDGALNVWVEAIFRWIHVVAGITWIGHLYFFNFVNAQLVKTYDADSKKKVLPELMPRALYWFRWGAAYTWLTGFGLVGLVYYMQKGTLVPEGGMAKGAAIGLSFTLVVLVFFIYDILWKTIGKNETVGVVVSFLLITATAFGLSQVFTGRATFLHIGGLFGTTMAMNVWMRIWPAQRKIIAGVKGTGTAPDPAVPALAGLRSKHNTYMSVPLVFFMLVQHYSDYSWPIVPVVVLLGWGVTKLLYMKSAGPAPASF